MWDYLCKAEKPIVLYGTGDAAEMILDELERRSIRVSGIFASDGFVRSRVFRGFPVKSYSDLKTELGNMIVLLSFGSHLPEVIENIKRIASEQELYAPDLPIYGTELFTTAYAGAHAEDISWIRNILADEQSRRVLDNVIAYKCDGKLQHLFDCETPDDECWELLDISGSESFLDLGAYNGDTVRQFHRCCSGRFKTICAVEPDPRNFRKLSENTAFIREQSENIELLNIAISDRKAQMLFKKNSGRGSADSFRHLSLEEIAKICSNADDGIILPGSRLIPEDKVDNICAGKDVTIIKLDLEGQEPLALAGAEETICRQKPKLLLSAYHRIDDLWELPKLLLKYNPDYKFYLRHSPCIPAWEINYIVKP